MSLFSIKAEGGVHAADRAEIRRALSLLIAPGDRHELRRLPATRAVTIDGGDVDAATNAAVVLSDGQVYYSLNPIQPDASRASKKTVVKRRWFLIDVDTIRPKDVSATEQEKGKSSAVAVAIVDHLSVLGWPAPILVDSGNGWHLLYRIDLPNDALSQQILKAAVYRLAEQFDGDVAIVDRATHDAPRISKLPGTLARKGPDTADRPHRLARITYAPEALESVSVEQLQALGGKPHAPNGQAPDPWKLRACDGPGLTGYVKSAVERECGRVALATSGDRNNSLNVASFSLGTMAGWPEMDERSARDALSRVAAGNGLADREILLTVASGWAAGKAEPRERPAGDRPTLKVVKPSAFPESRLVVRASEIKPKVVKWLWPNRIAIGFITIFAGRTGVGKSFVLCDFISRITTGRPLPDSTVGSPPVNVLMISEDPYDYVLAPRLKEMGADTDRVSFLTWEAMASYTLSDLEMLERAYVESDEPVLVAIDPPANFLGGKADEHKNSEVRQILMGIVAWLNSKSVACVMITHVNKQVGKGVEAVDRIMGSVAWASTSRVALGFAPDPNQADRCLFAGIKNNLGPKAPTLAYEIKTTADLAIVEWHGQVDTTADEAMNQTKKKSRRVSAAEFLVEQFRLKRCWASDDLIQVAREAGLSRNALFEAKGDLPIMAKQVTTQDGQRFWEWQARPPWPPDAAEETPGTLETLGPCPSKSNQDNTYHRVPNREGVRDGESLSQSPRVSQFQEGEGVGLGERDRELTAALRWLAGMLTRSPIPKDRFYELGNRLLIDAPAIDNAALALKVIRTIEEGREMWSIS